MKLSTALLSQQLRFNFNKNYIQNPKVKAYNMEALGHKNDKNTVVFRPQMMSQI